MAKEIKTWEIINEELKEIDGSLVDAGRKEKEHLEKWIKTNPKILGEDIVIIGEQVHTKSGVLDLLGIDNSGNIVVVELKRDKLPRDVVTQAIDYASDIATWDIDKLNEVCMNYKGQALYDYLSDSLLDVEVDELVINQAQRLLLVGFSIEEPLNRMIEWLSTNYDIGINAIILHYIRTSAGNELLSKTVIIPEEVEKAKTDKKKFKIPMSDEPGKYSDEDLKDALKNYLSKDLWSARRIKNILLPCLLEKEKITREELKKEFVNKGGAKDENQAGYFIALISNQLGQEVKDYLRQVISYEYPNYPWEKDHFSLRKDYRSLVEQVLEELKDTNNDI